jgi:hypothetical protein
VDDAARPRGDALSSKEKRCTATKSEYHLENLDYVRNFTQPRSFQISNHWIGGIKRDGDIV